MPKVINKKASGETVVIIDTPDVKTNAKVVNMAVTLDKSLLPSFNKAVKFWESLNSKSKQTLDELNNLGKVLKAGKLSVNNNNNIYSVWRLQKFVGMTSRYGSYAIQLHDNFKEIMAAFTELKIENNQWSNPESVMNAYRKAITEEPENKKRGTGKDDPPAPAPAAGSTEVDKVVSLETLTPEKRIETFSECINMIIETSNKGRFTSEQIATLIKRVDNVRIILVTALKEKA